MTVVTEVVIMTSFSKKIHLNTLTTDPSQGSFSQLLRCFSFNVHTRQPIIPLPHANITPDTQCFKHLVSADK